MKLLLIFSPLFAPLGFGLSFQNATKQNIEEKPKQKKSHPRAQNPNQPTNLPTKQPSPQLSSTKPRTAVKLLLGKGLHLLEEPHSKANSARAAFRTVSSRTPAPIVNRHCTDYSITHPARGSPAWKEDSPYMMPTQAGSEHFLVPSKGGS